MTVPIKTLAAVAAGRVPATSAFAQSAREIGGASSCGGFMPAQTPDLFLLEDLEDVSRTRKLAQSDRNALRAVADWTRTFVAKPHGVISDWKFFLNSEDWLRRWARRYGGSAVQALAEELRRLPWRARRD